MGAHLSTLFRHNIMVAGSAVSPADNSKRLPWRRMILRLGQASDRMLRRVGKLRVYSAVLSFTNDGRGMIILSSRIAALHTL